MPRKATTPQQARKNVAAHIAASQRALKTLAAPLSTEDVCYCPDGSDAGVTEAECGCQYRDAAKILEAAGCYVRRAQASGLI